MVAWMSVLAKHFNTVRQGDPQGKLLIVFNIDHAILDLPGLLADAARAYDEAFNTQYSQDRSPLLERDISPQEKEKILAWYAECRMCAAFLDGAHRPIPGVLEVIRWFQMQPGTDVGLCANHPQDRRNDLLHLMNHLGEEHRVAFSDQLLYLSLIHI